MPRSRSTRFPSTNRPRNYRRTPIPSNSPGPSIFKRFTTRPASRTRTELPQASKLAAAKAFLKATGKSSVDVLNDAARKIKVVRAIEGGKAEDSRQGLTQQQNAIDDLQKQIDELRTAMEAAKKDLESVRTQCLSEEARLQGARMFFGAMDKLADAPPTPPPPAAKK